MRKLSLTVVLFIVLALLLNSCEPTPTPTISASVETPSVSSDWYAVYFSDPTGPSAEYYSGGPDEALAKAIDQARVSVDMAVYDLDLSSISNALIDAHRRGVQVRVVTESDNMDSKDSKIGALKEASIPVIGDRHEGYSHNKFTVIDRMEVWGGSMNYTSNDAYRNDNNLIRIRSSRLAEIYTAEFKQMFEDDLFGSDKKPVVADPVVTVNGTEIEVYFSPEDGVARYIIEQIQGAKQSIYFLAFSFTADDIADAMLERAQAGVTVAGVFEKTQVASSKSSNEYDGMRAAGLDVWLDANPKNMHNKVIIIDGQTVITGSYNYSANAEKNNDENILIIHNADIAGLYLQDYQRIYERAKK
jgi:phosphatidylserine/phosphatidylglycerophosphate/cardiolipin synthase-like enzyme